MLDHKYTIGAAIAMLYMWPYCSNDNSSESFGIFVLVPNRGEFLFDFAKGDETAAIDKKGLDTPSCRIDKRFRHVSFRIVRCN